MVMVDGMNIKFLTFVVATLALLGSEASAQANHNSTRSNKTQAVMGGDGDGDWVMEQSGRNPQTGKEIRTGGEVIGAISITKGTRISNGQASEIGKCYAEQKEVPCPDLTKVTTDAFAQTGENPIFNPKPDAITNVINAISAGTGEIPPANHNTTRSNKTQAIMGGDDDDDGDWVVEQSGRNLQTGKEIN